jgi:hypothetical protein
MEMGKEGEKYCVGSEQSAGAPRWNDRGAAACAGLGGAVHSWWPGGSGVMLTGCCVCECVPAVDGGAVGVCAASRRSKK